MGNNSSKPSSHGSDGLQSYPSFSRVDTQGSTRSARSSRSVRSKMSTSSTNASANSPPSIGSPRLAGANDDPGSLPDNNPTLTESTAGTLNNDPQSVSADPGNDSSYDHHHQHHHHHHQSSRGFIRGASPLGQRLHRRTNSSTLMGNSSSASPHHPGSRSASPGAVFYPPPSMQTVEPKEPILIRRGGGPLSIDAQKSEGFSVDGEVSLTSPVSGQSVTEDPLHGQSTNNTDTTTPTSGPVPQQAVRQSSFSSGIRSPHPSQVIGSESPVPSSDNSPLPGNLSGNPPSPGVDHKSFLSRSKATYVAKQSPPSSLTSMSRSSNELTMGSSSLDVDEIIQRLLDAGYSGKVTKSVCLKNAEINVICATARNIFLSQPALLELAPSVKIVGDVHGQYGDLLRLFDKCGFPPRANYLFLGDYVDRGKQSLETILLLLCYKIKYPENFFLLRGNHECANVTRVYGFYDECKRRASIKTWKTFIDTFNTLPIAAVVASKIFCVHGGLSPSLNSMDDIRNIIRPTDVPDYGLLNDLLWSDPADTINEWEDNERGVSYCFGKIAINKFLGKFGFDLICRAHMVVEDGYEFFNERSLVTVFSAPNYCGEFDNWGAVMGVSEELLCSFELIKPLDSVSLKQEMKKGRYERKNGLHASPPASQVPQSY